jgi:hypothetical protein
MATAYIDNDLIEELYECVPHNDDVPDEIFETNCQKKNGIGYVLLYDQYNKCHKFYHKHTRFVCKGNKLLVFYKKYRDPYTGKIYNSNEMFQLRNTSIISEHYYNTNGIQQKIKCMYYCNDIAFIFKIENKAKKHALCLELIKKHLEKSNSSPILSLELLNMIDDEYINYLGNKIKYELEYKGYIPKIISKDQLKKLYEAGLVNIATLAQPEFDDKTSFVVLSDDAFDTPGGFSINYHFITKKNMHKLKKRILENFFKCVM